MAKVKVGQIYGLPWTKSPVVVTNIHCTPEEQLDMVYVISASGAQEKFWRKTVETMELIAEYPTWQEAVNSPEFKGEK